MGLAASSYTSSQSGGKSLPLPHRPSSHSHLDTVIGGISPEDTQTDDDEEIDGLSTIKESSRSSSNVNLLTPRVSLGGKALADSPSSTSGDISPKNGSLPSSGPSGLSLMLNRTVPSPKKGEIKKGRKREVKGTDELASGASGVLGVLDFPEGGEEKDGDRLGAASGMSTSTSPRWGRDADSLQSEIRILPLRHPSPYDQECETPSTHHLTPVNPPVPPHRPTSTNTRNAPPSYPPFPKTITYKARTPTANPIPHRTRCIKNAIRHSTTHGRTCIPLWCR
jgi:hypothetical protein